MEIGGSLLLVGCGKMGGALLGGWLERGVAPGSVTVVEPQADLAAGFAERGVNAVTGPGALPPEAAPEAAPAVVVLAVKPQQMDAVLPDYARFARPGTVFLSIAAGKNIGYFEGHLGTGAAMQGIASHAGRRPKALGNRRSGRAGEPAAGESVRASGSLDDVPHRPRLSSYPADRLPDLYGSLSALLGISLRSGPALRPGRPCPCAP